MTQHVPLAPATPEPSRLLTVAQAVEILNLGQATVYRLMQTGKLVSVKVNKSRRIPARCLDEFVNAAIEEATANLPQPRHVAMRLHASAPRRRAGASPHNDAGRSTPQQVSGQQGSDTTMAAASARPLEEASSCDADER